MSDDVGNTGSQDRSRVAAGQDYEVRHFAERHGITIEQAQQLIAEHGNSREKLDQAARKMKS